MGRISNFPRGVLDLLGSYDQGQAPAQLGDIVAPVVDFLEMYLASRKEIVFASRPGNTLNSADFNTFHTVPPGEVWVVDAATAKRNAGGDAAITAGIAVGITVGPNVMDVGPFVLSTAGAEAIATWTNRLWLPSGATLGITIANASAAYTAASTWEMPVLVARLRSGN